MILFNLHFIITQVIPLFFLLVLSQILNVKRAIYFKDTYYTKRIKILTFILIIQAIILLGVGTSIYLYLSKNGMI